MIDVGTSTQAVKLVYQVSWTVVYHFEKSVLFLVNHSGP